MDFSAYEKGNPFMSYNHIQICKVDPDCCVVKVNLVAESMNLHGHVHGGLLYAMADCVAGIFARMDGRDYVTQSAHINFLHNVQSGTIFAKAEIIKRGKHMAYFHISITDQDDHLLCDGMVDMYCISGCQTESGFCYFENTYIEVSLVIHQGVNTFAWNYKMPASGTNVRIFPNCRIFVNIRRPARCLYLCVPGQGVRQCSDREYRIT